MAVNAGQLFSQTDGTTNIDTILTQEANRIGQDIHRRTLHTSPWMDLIKQTSFPEGMGYKLGTLIYERALPVTTANGTSLVSSSWTEVGANDASANVIGTPSMDQLLAGGRDTFLGPQNDKSFIHFTRMLKQYSLQRSVVESPRINVEDLRFAAYRQEQLRAIMDALTESTRYTWEQRYRDEYDAACAGFVKCVASGTAISTADSTPTDKEGLASADIDFGSADADLPTANISNKILDTLYFRLVRTGAGTNAYGRENAKPVFGLVLSSEASYALQTESGFRDDIRYNSSKVSELIAPLGVEKSFRGYYHLVDDMAPRFTGDGDGTWTRVLPYEVDNSTKAVKYNTSYDTAEYEAAYVLHQDVMESQIPEPITGGNGLTFDPVNYRGKFTWMNIKSEVLNPDGTIGFFRGILASASKRIKTEYGFVVLFKRTSTTPAA